MSKMIIPGGSGYLGRHVSRWYAERGWEVVVLSRGVGQAEHARLVQWDGATLGSWAAELEGAELVVNLAGRTVNCRYHARNRQQILDSRVQSTRAIGEAIATCDCPPPVWLNSSSATFYRHAEDRVMDESTGEIGSGFSVDVCQQWEHALAEAATPRTRKVALRTSLVFGPGVGGVYGAFRNVVRLGGGGRMASGRQFVSWIHWRDFCRVLEWVREHGELDGPVNVTAPNPLPNAEFMRCLREAVGMPFGMPSMRWMLEVGAFFLRTETELLLKSRRVKPGRLLISGFEFEFEHIADALAEIETE